MTLTKAPQTKAGPLLFERSPRWVHAEVDGVMVADSRQPLLLWEEDKVIPVYLFPREDVRTDLLRPSEKTPPEAHHGLVSYWTLEVSGRTVENAAWTYSAAPQPEGENLADYVAFKWDAMDAWYEEEERVIAHPRDPYHRVDTRESSRHVRVAVGGETLAASRSPRLVFETGLPTRYYLPREDVRMDLLEPSAARTLCAYKGKAHYFSAEVNGKFYEDIAWTYPEPLVDNLRLRDLICFFNERADIHVDGERIERPTTQWS